MEKYSFNPYDYETVESRRFRTGRTVTLGKSNGCYGIVREKDFSPTLEVTRAPNLEDAKEFYGRLVEEEEDFCERFVDGPEAEKARDETEKWIEEAGL